MDQPTTSRVTALRRTRAWPLLVFLIGTGRLRLDLGLAAAKNLTGLGEIVEAQPWRGHRHRPGRRPSAGLDPGLGRDRAR